MDELIKELENNQKVNYENNLENKVDIDYILERLEDIEEERKADPVDYILECINELDKMNQYDLIYNALYNMMENTKKEAYKEIEKDNEYYNIHLKTLYNEIENLKKIIERLEY